MKKDDILAALATMPPADLKALQAVINSLLGQKAIRVPHKQNNPIAWLYEAMAAILNSPQSYDSFIATGAGKQFTKAAPDAVAFIMAHFEQVKGSRIKAVAIMRHVLGLLAADMRLKEIPLTRNTMSANLVRLPEVFDAAYPGYLRGGIAALISKAIINR